VGRRCSRVCFDKKKKKKKKKKKRISIARRRNPLGRRKAGAVGPVLTGNHVATRAFRERAHATWERDALAKWRRPASVAGLARQASRAGTAASPATSSAIRQTAVRVQLRVGLIPISPPSIVRSFETRFGSLAAMHMHLGA